MTITDFEAWVAKARAVPIEEEIERRGIKLKPVGAELIGPCPACGGRDRFGINTRKQKWNCRGYGGGNDVIGLIQHLDGCDFRTAITTVVANIVRRRAMHAPAHDDDDKDEHYKLDQAEAIWRQTSPLVPDAIAYFANRKIDITAVPGQGGLRFHSRCPWGNGTTAAIIGRFTGAVSNAPRGIWRRPISGEKPKTLGPIKGCVIRLWPDTAVERGLVLGEGPETVLAAATWISHRGTLLVPAWAAGGSSNIKKFPVLSGIEALTLLVDNDRPDKHDRRAGQDAAAECATRWSAAAREVIRLTPKALGADFNDVVLRHGA
jgi:phage/plasmid primase-like uncharacterized protein